LAQLISRLNPVFQRNKSAAQPMKDYQREFLDFAIDCEALRFAASR